MLALSSLGSHHSTLSVYRQSQRRHDMLRKPLIVFLNSMISEEMAKANMKLVVDENSTTEELVSMLMVCVVNLSNTIHFVIQLDSLYKYL